jgi:hypothetical protein
MARTVHVFAVGDIWRGPSGAFWEVTHITTCEDSSEPEVHLRRADQDQPPRTLRLRGPAPHHPNWLRAWSAGGGP